MTDYSSNEVVATQHAIDVYTNPQGDVVIRQDRSHVYHDDESFIFIRPENVRALVNALMGEAAANLDQDTRPPLLRLDIDKLYAEQAAFEAQEQEKPSAQAKDRTAAERKRRQREKERAERESQEPPLLKVAAE